MTIANIVRPTCTENFTVLPNFLFDFNRNFNGLKPRDSAILNYLLTKPATWKLRAGDIATAINVCERTVYKALRKLQDLGFARFIRKSSGFTDWFICVPDAAQIPAKSPHGKKSNVTKSHGKTCPVLTNTEKSLEKIEHSLTKIQKTTNGRVEFVEIDIAEFNPQQKIIAQKSLSKIPTLTQQIVLIMLKAALTKGGIKSPLAYLNALINKAIVGKLDTTHVETMSAPNVISRDDKIRRLFAKHRDKITAELNANGFIFIDGEGSIYKSDFEKLGLIEKMTKTGRL